MIDAEKALRKSSHHAKIGKFKPVAKVKPVITAIAFRFIEGSC
jgi:hypothetical protein